MVLLVILFSVHHVQAQRVLHFTKTSGFDHGTREVSFSMFTSIGSEIGAEVIDDADGSSFNDLATLAEFDVVVFANTSGNAILDEQQRSNFETWIAQGGHLMGIHAATDTYRHSSANGADTGVWDFYPIMIGGSVQSDPHHVSGTPSFALHKLGTHPSTVNLPDPWQKEEEYYYWENGYLHPDIVPVLEVEQTIGPNGMVNSYDAPRPMSWYRTTGMNRIFYTALGHAASNYTSDPLFRTHVKDALLWLLEVGTSIEVQEYEDLSLIYDPFSRTIIINGEVNGPDQFQLFDPQGRLIDVLNWNASQRSFNMADRTAGFYFITNGAKSSRILVW